MTARILFGTTWTEAEVSASMPSCVLSSGVVRITPEQLRQRLADGTAKRFRYVGHVCDEQGGRFYPAEASA